jgi:hypothetical protein
VFRLAESAREREKERARARERERERERERGDSERRRVCRRGESDGELGTGQAATPKLNFKVAVTL